MKQSWCREEGRSVWDVLGMKHFFFKSAHTSEYNCSIIQNTHVNPQEQEAHLPYSSDEQQETKNYRLNECGRLDNGPLEDVPGLIPGASTMSPYGEKEIFRCD